VAILVTVFGHYSRHAGRLVGATSREAARHVFTVGASHAFIAAALFLVGALVLVAAGVRAPRTTAAIAPAGASVED